MCSDNGLKCPDIKGIDKLKGRIYPAIQSCVGNRYKILISFFAFYSFIMTSEISSIRNNFDNIQKYASILFILLSGLNFYNYWRNAKEQWGIENNGKKYGWREWYNCIDVELFFFLIMVSLVFLFYCLIKDC